MANILVVDDSAIMRMTVRRIFEKAGHVVVGEGVDGFDGLEKYKKLKPDIVTMDITMPQMDGIEATREIANFDPNAKIIICSAIGQQSKVVEAIKAGAKDFFVKPFQGDKILESIKECSSH